MNNFVLNTDDNYNLFELCGRTDRVSVCAYDMVTINKNVYNSSKVNLDTKFYFDHLHDEDAITVIAEHYNTNKYYTPSYLDNLVNQVTIIPASIYTYKGMKNGFLILNNRSIEYPTILISGIYNYKLFDNPTDAGKECIIELFDNTYASFKKYSEAYYNYNNIKQHKLEELRKQLEEEIEQKINTYSETLDQENIYALEMIKKGKAFAKRNEYLVNAFKIDKNKYKELFDND